MGNPADAIRARLKEYDVERERWLDQRAAGDLKRSVSTCAGGCSAARDCSARKVSIVRCRHVIGSVVKGSSESVMTAFMIASTTSRGNRDARSANCQSLSRFRCSSACARRSAKLVRTRVVESLLACEMVTPHVAVLSSAFAHRVPLDAVTASSMGHCLQLLRKDSPQ